MCRPFPYRQIRFNKSARTLLQSAHSRDKCPRKLWRMNRMTPEQTDFRVGVVKPIECIQEGYALIKDQYWLFMGIALVAILIGGAVPIVLMGPMMVGLYI